MKRVYNYLIISLSVSLFIYLFSLIWVPFMKRYIEQSPSMWYMPNIPVQILAVIVPTVIAICKFKQKNFLFSLLVLYVLFFLFPIEGCHLLVYIQPKRQLVLFSGMPSWESALYIVIQYGLIMLLTTLFTVIAIRIIHYFNHRKKSKEIQSEDSNDL